MDNELSYYQDYIEVNEFKKEGKGYAKPDVYEFRSRYSLAKWAMSLLTPNQVTEILDDYCIYCGAKLCRSCKEEKEADKIKNDKNNY